MKIAVYAKSDTLKTRKEHNNMPFSDTYANQILNYTLGKVLTLHSPSEIFLGLCTNDPEADGGTFNELSGGNYKRLLVFVRGNTYMDYFSDADERAIKNDRQINWDKATADWEAANGFGLFAEEDDEIPFFYGKLDLTDEQIAEGGLKVPLGAVALFEPGKLKISFSTTDTVETT